MSHIKDALKTYYDLQSAGGQPFTLDLQDMNTKTAPMAPNLTKCLTCGDGYHGLPAIRTGNDGQVKDTLKPNNTGGVDTIPTVRN